MLVGKNINLMYVGYQKYYKSFIEIPTVFEVKPSPWGDDN